MTIKKKFFIVVLALLMVSIYGQNHKNTLIINVDLGKDKISKHIYGHFAEHLGRCIYGGIYVGEDSPIPNTNGMRNDVVNALRDIDIPNLRWPGGCFADTYHWMDGIGPKSERKKIVNVNWGGVIEDNSFGTHEFMELCKQLDCEPVICGNVGSGTVKEMVDWVDYLTSHGTPMAELRKKNGREKPWKVKFWGIGNESWGCGGLMSADYYSSVMRRYSLYLKNHGDNVLYKIAVGPYGDNYSWTETLMKDWIKTDGYLKSYMKGISLHYYTICHDWTNKGSATDFNEDEWFSSLFQTLKMDDYITGNDNVMSTYDPEKTVGLVVDEWGNWFDVEPGTNPSFLFQQNSLRDAMVASVNLDIFNNHCDRVKMANIAQTVNVLQSMVLTKDEQIVLTPTYYVFKMYKVHHDATLLPMNITSEEYSNDDKSIPAISSSASIDNNGLIHITISNLNPEKEIELTCELRGMEDAQFKRGEIINGEKINSYNDFGKAEEVNIKDFDSVDVNDNVLTISLPAKSIVMLELE